MRKILLFSSAIFNFSLPFIFSRQTQQIFELNKFAFLLFFSGLIFLLSFFYFHFEKKKKISFLPLPKKLFLITLLFFTFLIIGTIFSVSITESFWGSYFRHQGFLLFFIIFLFAFLLLIIDFKKQELFLFFCLPIFLAGIFQSIICLIQYFFPGQIFSDLVIEKFATRSLGTFGQPNFAARFLIFPFFIGFSWLFPKNQNIKKEKEIYFFKKFLIFFSLILIFSGILTTSSRAGIVGVITGIIIFFIAKFQLFKTSNFKFITKKNLTIAFLILFLSSGTFFIFKDKFLQRFASIDFRILLLSNAPQAIKKNPFLGWGLEGQEIALASIANEDMYKSSGGNILDRVHNEILDFTLQIGILGTLTYLLFLFLAFKQGWQNLTFLSKNQLKEKLISNISQQKKAKIIQEKNKNIFFLYQQLGIFSALIGTFIARQFGFFSTVESYYFFIFLFFFAGLKQDFFTKENIYITGFKKNIFIFSLLIISFCCFYSTQKIWLADKLLFEKQYLTAHQKFPSNKIIAKKLILTSLRKKDFSKAEKTLTILEKFHPHWSETYYLRALFFYEKNSLQQAQKNLQKALDSFSVNKKYQNFMKQINHQ